MAVIPHVNGTAQIFVGTGQDYSYELLGISVDGVTFKETLLKEPVIVDTFFKCPWDFQYSLQEMEISMDLVLWERVVLQDLKGRLLGVNQGVAGPAGTLFVLQNHTFPMLITSTPLGVGITGDDLCTTFYHCFLDDAYEVKVGTERSIYKLKFKAMYPQSITASAGLVMWDNSCA